MEILGGTIPQTSSAIKGLSKNGLNFLDKVFRETLLSQTIFLRLTIPVINWANSTKSEKQTASFLFPNVFLQERQRNLAFPALVFPNLMILPEQN